MIHALWLLSVSAACGLGWVLGRGTRPACTRCWLEEKIREYLEQYEKAGNDG